MLRYKLNIIKKLLSYKASVIELNCSFIRHKFSFIESQKQTRILDNITYLKLKIAFAFSIKTIIF